MKEQQVILVNEADDAIGVMGKMEAHQKGVLHRAFSVFIFNSKGRMLLQQRALSKYHGANLWTNTCCSHPYPGERTEEAAQRRLQEEMGFIANIKEIFSFTYKAQVENGLIEHEYDHVFAGEHEGSIESNKNEVAAYSYEEMDEVKQRIQQQPEKFTAWFKIAFPKIEAWWKEEYGSKLKVHSSGRNGFEL
jgi:isopentenyl-diphosphate delta-isomerase